MAAWFRITMHCKRCGLVWRRRTQNPDSPDPPCPNLKCGEVPTPIGLDLSLQKAPGIVGMSIQTKAIDETAKIVMEDHGLTDLRSDVRPGETAQPKLHPQLQAQADNFFAGGKAQPRGNMPFNPAALASAAISGRLRDPVSTQRSIGAMHEKRISPPIHTVADDRFLKH